MLSTGDLSPKEARQVRSTDLALKQVNALMYMMLTDEQRRHLKRSLPEVVKGLPDSEAYDKRIVLKVMKQVLATSKKFVAGAARGGTL